MLKYYLSRSSLEHKFLVFAAIISNNISHKVIDYKYKGKPILTTLLYSIFIMPIFDCLYAFFIFAF